MSEIRDVSGVPTTGHVWDEDLGDFVNQPPRWWMLGLTASALFVVIYWIYYPSIPMSTKGSFFAGVGGWSAIKEMEADAGEVDAVRGKYEAKLKNLAPAAILADNELTEYVKRSGKVLFGDNCAACHGQNGAGAYVKDGLFAPKLNDDDWLFGGKIDDIYASITGGRQGMMPAQKDNVSAAEIDTLANAIAQGNATSTPLFAAKGCTACHGEDGKGMAPMGSANLTDKIWRFEGTVEGIKRTISYGVNSGDPKARIAVMPNFKEAGKLSDAEMKKLAVYVYKFGGGQAEAPAAPVVVAEPAASAPVAAEPAAKP